MENVSTVYSEEEQAWVSPEMSVHRDIYVMVSLSSSGKLVIRQNCGDGKWVRVPIKAHKDTDKFLLRIRVSSSNMKIKFYTSSKPKEIKYDYI